MTTNTAGRRSRQGRRAALVAPIRVTLVALVMFGACWAKPSRGDDLGAAYAADLTRATAGERRVPFPSSGSFGDMSCSPSRISGRDAASRALVLTLPRDAVARDRALAVVAPERGLLEVYSPHRGEEAADIVVPSPTLTWALARRQRRFATRAEELGGLRPGRDVPEALFLEPGRYRFALVDGVDAEASRTRGTPVRVTAACSFDWTP